MENFKDVIISQPPPMYAQANYTTSIPLENYKGVLLCDRPTSLTYDAGGRAGVVRAGAEPGAFFPGGALDPGLGLPPSNESRALRERNIQRMQDNVRNRRVGACKALSRHRKWLRSFAAQMRQMKQEDIDREVEAARRAERLRQRTASDKNHTCPCGYRPSGAADSTSAAVGCRCCPAGAAVNSAVEGQNLAASGYTTTTTVAADAAGSKSKAKKTKKQKPRWAMTADEAFDDELEANDDLVDFAKHLDYDRFVNDYEVAEALAVMRERVYQIAKENNLSEDEILIAADGDDDVESCVDASGERVVRVVRRVDGRAAEKEGHKPLPASYATHTQEWDSSGRRGVLRGAIRSDAIALAERILASSESMQKIHTKNSLAKLLQRCVLNGTDAREQMQQPTIGSVPVIPPKVVKINPDAEPMADGVPVEPTRVLREMQLATDRTQGLPYMYRCPAI